MNKAYLLTGSNMGNRVDHLQAAAALTEMYTGTIVKMSAIYETAPWGKTDQAAFLNQAFLLDTVQDARELMRNLLLVEEQAGRKRFEKYGPRIIDIDILLFNNEVYDSELVKIPHPELHNRRFALTPMAEIAGEQLHPVLQRTMEQLLAQCPDTLPVSRWNPHPPAKNENE